MAKGDRFGIKVSWQNEVYLIAGICDTDIFNKKAPASGTYDFTGENPVKAMEAVDEFFESDFWQVTKLPFVKFSDSQDLLNEAKLFFPGATYIEYNDIVSGSSLYYNGEEVPDSAIKKQKSAGDYFIYGGTSINELYFPPFKTRTLQNATLAGIGACVIVAKDDFITDGKITSPSTSNVRYAYIEFRGDPGDIHGGYITYNNYNYFNDYWNEKEITYMPGGNDPFEPGGGSETGGGGGDFDNTSTPIEIPNLPTVSAASTGFISLFNPTLSQLNELASYLWSDLFEIDGWKKLFADPMDAILGLSILPVPIPTSGPKEVKVGNIGTGISLNVASTQFVEVDCGSINVNEYWGAYLDYSPYTQCQIYLPYVGARPISVDEIMGKTINVKYHVDILTGACCCFIKCGDSVLYTFNGQCSIPIPINSANYTSVINGIISVAASVGSMIATGGASAPLAVPHLASTVANQMKPNIEKSGAISGSGAVLNIQTPYLILTRPRQALPKNQNTFTGYPSFITVTLGELSGYTEVHSIHLENIPATADELSEIEALLKGGVIF